MEKTEFGHGFGWPCCRLCYSCSGCSRPLLLLESCASGQCTHNAHVEPWGKISSDGALVFFLTKEVDGLSLMQVSASGGEPQPFPSPIRNTHIMDISQDMSEFFVEQSGESGWNMEFGC